MGAWQAGRVSKHAALSSRSLDGLLVNWPPPSSLLSSPPPSTISSPCCCSFSNRLPIISLHLTLSQFGGFHWTDAWHVAKSVWTVIDMRNWNCHNILVSCQHYYFLFSCFFSSINCTYTHMYISPLSITCCHNKIPSACFFFSASIWVRWHSRSVASTSLHSWEAKAL